MNSVAGALAGGELEGQGIFHWDWISVVVRIQRADVRTFWKLVCEGGDEEGVSKEVQELWKKRIKFEFFPRVGR